MAMIAFHEAIAAQLGISATEWKCLGVVSQIQPATAGQIAQSTGLTTGAITGIVDRLERAGFVQRERNPDDRRSVLVRALRETEIRETVAPIFQSLSAAMADVASHYGPTELAAIQDYFARTIQVLKKETAKVKASKAQGRADRSTNKVD